MKIPIKIMTKTTPFKRFPKTNFLFIQNTYKVICSKCLKPIINDEYCFVCSDLSNIWHEICFDKEHIKSTFKKIINLKYHSDWFCLIKYLDQVTYEAFKTNEKILIIRDI